MPAKLAKPVGRRAVRLRPNWQSDWRKPEIEQKSEIIAIRRRSTRLPPQWAAVIRASEHQAIIVERHLPAPERVKDCDMNTKRIVEAILFAANRPMTIRQIQETFPELEQPDTLTIQMALEDIARDYADRPIGLRQLASGYRFQVREGLSPYVTRLFEEKPARYSRALLETLAIIAYRQPVTRGEIEDIRGVSVSSSIIQTLLEREWIRVIAHKEVPGRPALFGTTKLFLDYFNLTSLNDLPTLQEIADFDFGNPPQPQTEQDHSERSQTVETAPTVNPSGAPEADGTEPQTEVGANAQAETGADGEKGVTLH
ncbi:SMC-Scp complex subunit ScpB [Methylomonas sp. EFPC3]|uniref:SMC-Scp complex subunit ScpB n=1 Tax=Methylomonas sp. EFPC3 TaxID=3021710 RepID=UPI00325B8BAA